MAQAVSGFAFFSFTLATEISFGDAAATGFDAFFFADSCGVIGTKAVGSGSISSSAFSRFISVLLALTAAVLDAGFGCGFGLCF